MWLVVEEHEIMDDAQILALVGMVLMTVGLMGILHTLINIKWPSPPGGDDL